MKKFLVVMVIIFILASISAASAEDLNITGAIQEEASDIDDEIPVLSNDISADDEANSDSKNVETPLAKSESNEVIGEAKNVETTLKASDNDEILKSDETHTVKISFYKQTGQYSHNKKIYIKVTDAQTGKPLKTSLTVFAYNYNSKPNDFNWKWFFFVDTNSKGIGVLKWSKYDEHGTYKIRVEGGAEANGLLYDVDKNCKNLAKVKVYKKLSIKIKRELGGLNVFLKLNKKPIKNIKLKVKIYTGKKYKTIYMTSGNLKKSKYKGYCGFITNDLKVGKHSGHYINPQIL